MTNIGEKTTCSCKTCEHIVTEVCPHCEAEVEMRWNVAADGYKTFCPHCGKRLMLCDACQHPEDKCVENCDYNSETDTCRHNQPAQELKAGDVCTYGFGTENASRATVKIVELLPRSEAATVMFLSVERDDTGNGMFNYLLKTGNTMNASLKYLTKIECSSDQERDNYAELEKLCTECDTEFCVFNPHGICKLPFVTGKAPRLGDDGCQDYAMKDFMMKEDC